MPRAFIQQREDDNPISIDVNTRRGRERTREVFTGRQISSLTTDELVAAKVAGYEPSDTDEGGDYLVGRDPRKMTQDELIAMGHEAMSPLSAIRTKCLDCAGSYTEVRKCVALCCPSWPFRTGKNPWRAPPTEAQREQGRRRAAELHSAKNRLAENLDTEADE